MCQTRVLTSSGKTVISNCIGCRMYYVWHCNLALSFPEAGFNSFKEIVDTVCVKKNLLPFPDGHDRIILHTPNDDISFVFDLEELEDFKLALAEAVYMNEVYMLMEREPGQ